MTSKVTKNIAASIHQRLQNLGDIRQDFQYVLIRFAAERLLYRLSRSLYRDRFVLKGAMLFAAWSGNSARPTKDVDLLGLGSSSIGELREMFREVCAVEAAEDGLSFDVESVRARAIREEQEDGGIRVSANALLGRARIPVQVDVGFGDVVVPEAMETALPTLLDLPAPVLRVYPREAVVAEKVEALVKLGIATSRMKDLYDLHVLAREFAFDGASLAKAIGATFEQRKTALPASVSHVLGDVFSGDTGKRAQWRAFLKRINLTDESITLQGAVHAAGEFVGPPIVALLGKGSFDLHWPPGGPWQSS